MLFMDSLKAHQKNKVANHLRKWLCSEWKRLGIPFEGRAPGKLFTSETMPIFAPHGELEFFLSRVQSFGVLLKRSDRFVSSCPHLCFFVCHIKS